MAYELMSKDLQLRWVATKLVPHHLIELNKANLVIRCQDLIKSLPSRLTMKNIVTVDEKLFYCRYMKPRNVIGSWLFSGGDEVPRQTPRRTNIEKKLWLLLQFLSAASIILRHCSETNTLMARDM